MSWLWQPLISTLCIDQLPVISIILVCDIDRACYNAWSPLFYRKCVHKSVMKTAKHITTNQQKTAKSKQKMFTWNCQRSILYRETMWKLIVTKSRLVRNISVKQIFKLITLSFIPDVVLVLFCIVRYKLLTVYVYLFESGNCAYPAHRLNCFRNLGHIVCLINTSALGTYATRIHVNNSVVVV